MTATGVTRRGLSSLLLQWCEGSDVVVRVNAKQEQQGCKGETLTHSCFALYAHQVLTSKGDFELHFRAGYVTILRQGTGFYPGPGPD